MHCPINTQNGAYGFVVELEDGTVVREDEATWDEVQGPIKSLSIAHLPTHQRLGHTYVTIRGFDRYFFSNAALSLRSSQEHTHTGKVFGGVNGDVAKMVSMSFGQKPLVTEQRECSVEVLGYSSHAFREGCK